jgi:hypothetical protein
MRTQPLPTNRAATPLMVVLAVLFIACGDHGSPDRTPAFVQRDSGGIVIAESSESESQRPLGWTMELDLQIGQVDGNGPDSFSRLSGIRQLSNRTIVVVDGGSQEIRGFVADGRFLFRAGGEGSGPGEFRYPQLVPTVLSDSLLILDINVRRFTLYGGNGIGHRAFAGDLPPDLVAGSPVGVLTNGLLFRTGSLPPNISSLSGQFETPVSVRWVATDGSAVDTLVVVPVSQFTTELGGIRYILEVPFSVRPSVAVGSSGFFVSDGYQVFEYSEDAELRGILRTAEESRPLTLAEFHAFAETQVAQFAGGTIDLRDVRSAYQSMQGPALYPRIESLVVDELGWLWARTFESVGSSEVTWWLFNPDRRAVGSVRTPADLEVHQVGTDFVLGRWHDDLGVEFVRRYSLVRGAQ